jgi:hypothetical protein
VVQLSKLGIVKTPRKPFMASGILRVLLFDGYAMLVLFPIPIGAMSAYEARHDYHWDWFWVAVAGICGAAAIALVGCVFLGLGAFITKHRVKRLGYHDIENDA